MGTACQAGPAASSLPLRTRGSSLYSSQGKLRDNCLQTSFPDVSPSGSLHFWEGLLESQPRRKLLSLALVFWLSFELEVKEVGAEYSRKELLNETLVKLSKFLTYPL